MILSASLASDRMPNILQWIQTIGWGQWDGHSLSSEWSSTTELHRIAIFRPRILQRGDMKLIKLCSTWRVIALLLLGSALLGATPPSVIAQGATTASSASKAQCDRSCLEGVASHYLDAMVAHDPSLAPLAPGVKYAQDNVPLNIGEALWATASGLGKYRHYSPTPTAATWDSSVWC